MGTIFTPEFTAMVVGIIVSLLVAVIPTFEAVRTELIVVITALVGLIIAGLSGEKIAAARSSGTTTAERASVKPYTAPVVKQP